MLMSIAELGDWNDVRHFTEFSLKMLYSWLNGRTLA